MDKVSNYIKVGVWRKRDESACGMQDLAEEVSFLGVEPVCVVGANSPIETRVDSYIWPFNTTAEAGVALGHALAVFDEAQRRGHAAQLSIYKPAPAVPALDRVAVILLKELGDEYND